MHPLDKHIVHVSTMLAVSDIRRSVAYYREKFGFAPRDEYDMAHIALLERGNLLLYLVSESPPTADKPTVTLIAPDTPDRTPIALVFRVDDCRAVYAELSALGVEFLSPPMQPEWGGWRCFARDPDGYLIEIEEP